MSLVALALRNKFGRRPVKLEKAQPIAGAFRLQRAQFHQLLRELVEDWGCDRSGAGKDATFVFDAPAPKIGVPVEEAPP
jgi:hypothetical protein